jgi:catechol 2,3-dioxygenase-like lactoylglutathione lyase family enzyme
MLMTIRALNHAALLVSDVERSRQFYSRVLELEEASRPATFAFPGAWLRKGSIELHLIGEAEEGRAAQVQPGYSRDEYARGYGSHLAFEVDDLDATRRHLRTQNVEIVGGPRDRGDGVQQIYICDPDGYMIEFFVFPSSKPV